MLKYEVIKMLHELEVYQTDWSTILEDMNNDNPFIEYEWISTWWEVLGRSHPVEIYVVKDGDKPIAFFPFEHTKRLGIHRFRFLGVDDALYMQVISSQEWVEKSIQFLFMELKNKYKRVIFELDGLLESKGTSKELEKFAVEKKFPYSIFRIVTPYIDLNKISNQQFIDELNNKMKDVHRCEGRLQSLGKLTFKPFQGDYLDEMFELYNRRWEKIIAKSNSSIYLKREFIEKLFVRSKPSFYVEINYLFFENRLISFTYDIFCRGRKVGVKIAHEPNFNIFGPNRIIEKDNLASANKLNYSVYDFGSGYKPYKVDWATNIDFTRKILMSSQGKKERLVRRIQSLLYFMKWKVNTNDKYVALKKERLSEVLHFIKAKSLKEKLASIKNFIKRKVSIIELYQLENNNLKKEETSFIELKIQDVLHKSDQAYLIPYYFKGYRILSHDGQAISYKRHDELIRDEEAGLIEKLPPKSIFIKDYDQSELLKIVCELGNEGGSIWTVVNRFALKKRKVLESIGFKKVERISKFTLFKWKKVTRKKADGGQSLLLKNRGH